MNATDRIRAARERLGLSQSEAARRCGMTRNSWHDLESGKRDPSLDRLWGIATMLGIDPHTLDPRLASTVKRRGGKLDSG